MTASDAPRREWLAVLLSLVTTGLGHFYAGQPRRALFVWLASIVWIQCGVVVMYFLFGWAELVTLAAVALTGPVLAARDAARMARRAGATYQLRPFNRWYLYLGIIAVSAFSSLSITALMRDPFLGTSRRLVSGAMEPTLLDGDYVLVHRVRGTIAAGDIVVHRSTIGSVVQRVVGLPRDEVGMRSGQMIVNERAIAEPYTQRDTVDFSTPAFKWQLPYLTHARDSVSYPPSLHTWGPISMPPGMYFLLGDNRSNSLDSRYLGFVVGDSIVGRPSTVYFSRDPETNAVRWGRIGRSAQR